MSKEQAEHNLEHETRASVEMLGKGYDHPSIVIEAEHTVVERQGRKLVEVDRPAFVKIYTNFKAEMRDIDEIALKVWLYIALSVNRKTNEAHPSLRTIAGDTGLAVNTVHAAVERLETRYNLMVVEREIRKYNRYFPLDYVSARRETVSADDTEVSETVSDPAQTVSARVILNQRNHNLTTTTTQAADPVNLFSMYESNIGPITPMIADSLEDAEQTYPGDWIADAIRLAVENNKRNWKYCEAILRRWQSDGKDDGKKPESAPRGNRNNGNSKTPEPLEETPEELEARIKLADELFGEK